MPPFDVEAFLASKDHGQPRDPKDEQPTDDVQDSKNPPPSWKQQADGTYAPPGWARKGDTWDKEKP